MAVVFISPKTRQRNFFLGITISLVVFLLFVTIGVFLSKPKKVPETMVFNKAKISIDMNFFNDDQFNRLEPFVQMQTQFVYTATKEDGEPMSGFISADSKEEATKILENIGLTVVSIKEAEIGRENPFTPYSQIIEIIEEE